MKRLITFAYSHYYSPYNTLEGFHNAYSYYLKNGELEKEKPSAPGNVTLCSENGVVVLEWDASNDNLGVVGYNVYRNGELLENICAKRGDNAVKVPGDRYGHHRLGCRRDRRFRCIRYCRFRRFRQ